MLCSLRRSVRTLSTYVYFFILFIVTFLLALLAGGAFQESNFAFAGEKIFANAPLVIDAFFSSIDHFIGKIIIVAVIGNDRFKDRSVVETVEGVEKVVPILAPYKMASLEMKSQRSNVPLGGTAPATLEACRSLAV